MSDATRQPSTQTRDAPPDDPDHTDSSTAGADKLAQVLKGGSLPGGTSLVFNRDGAVFANSCEVAAAFGKRHDHFGGMQRPHPVASSGGGKRIKL